MKLMMIINASEPREKHAPTIKLPGFKQEIPLLKLLKYEKAGLQDVDTCEAKFQKHQDMDHKHQSE